MPHFSYEPLLWMGQTLGFVIMAAGGLSAPNRPNFPGIDSFAGMIVQTSMWPDEGVELEIGPARGPVATGGGQDRGLVGRHAGSLDGGVGNDRS